MTTSAAPIRLRAGRLLAATATAALLAPLLSAPSAAGAVGAPAPAGATVAASAAWRTVLVTGAGGAATAEAAVRAIGGTVIDRLELISGVAARLPAGASLPAGYVETPQRSLQVSASGYGADAPVSTVRRTIGLPATGDEGAGVTVAVVDTGVADVPDLAGRLTHVDATRGGNGDGFGHGTFLAGVLAGSGASSGGVYRGVAPAASIVDVKVAGADGSTDLVTVLRGLQWVAHQGRKISVVNLSLSSNSPLPYQVDPLNQALQSLWQRGVVVVVPAGNDGPEIGSMSSPGNDPTLLTAGGLDENGTSTRIDDTVAVWSGRSGLGRGTGKPDLAAPGAGVIGLRAPGSVIDTTYAGSRIGADYFRGSGTSMSAAVLSGAVAGLLADHPQLRPDAVKALLASTAYDAAALRLDAGAGGLDMAAALARAEAGLPAQPAAAPDPDAEAIAADANAWQRLAAAIGGGGPESALRAWNALSPASRSWASRSWAQLDPASRSWASRSWASRSWGSRSWAGGSHEEWASRSWAAATWASRSWASEAWSSRSWGSRSWAADTWVSRSWASGDWASRSWASRSWAVAGWGDAGS